MISVVTRHSGGARHPRSQGLQRQRELVVLGQRQGVVDLSGRAGQQGTARLGHRPQRVGADHRRGAGQHEHPVRACGRPGAGSGCTRCAGTGRGADRRPRRRTGRRRRPGPGRPPAARAPLSRNSGAIVESASITSTTSRGSAWGRRRASCWFSAPAFFSVLPTVSTTSTPCAAATSTVASVQLSATTTTRSGGRVCPASDSNVSPRTASSLCAGMSTVHRTRCPAGSSSRRRKRGRRQHRRQLLDADQLRPRAVPASARRARRTALRRRRRDVPVRGRAPASTAAVCNAARPKKDASTSSAAAASTAAPGFPSSTLSGTNTCCSSASAPRVRREHPATTSSPTGQASPPHGEPAQLRRDPAGWSRPPSAPPPRILSDRPRCCGPAHGRRLATRPNRVKRWDPDGGPGAAALGESPRSRKGRPFP